MRSFSIAATLAYAGGVAAFWRMPCRSATGYGRIDPIVDRGAISPHVHAIHGSSGFGPNATYDDLVAPGTCTSCEVSQDHSAYWTPAMYFQYSNGTTVMVPQVGGMLAYYLYYLEQVKAFPEGFVMLAGDPTLRLFTPNPTMDDDLSAWPTNPTDQLFLQQRALGFNCLNYAETPEGSLARHQMPDKAFMDSQCTDGLRLELAFPSCGNGQLDSDDHRSHVAYPSLVKEGNCPEGYDVHYPFLFFETIWATNVFAGEDGQFLLSNGDPTGASYHGDFMMGWKSSDFLQSALDTCGSASGEVGDCSLFLPLTDDSVCAECQFEVPENVKDDDCHGPRDGLPVNVPIQTGPEPATKYNVAGAFGAIASSLSLPFTLPAFHPTAASPSHSVAEASHSVAEPSETAKAQDKIVIADYTPESSKVDIPTTTPAPVYSSAASTSSGSLSTTWITKGHEVIEMVIMETEVTVTAAAPTADSHKRHLLKHQHHHHMQ